MDAEIQGGGGLGGEVGNVAGAVLVRRRDDLDEGDESMAADVADGQGSATAQGPHGESVPVTRPGRRIGEIDTALRRACVERQYIGDSAAGVLFGQGVVALRQYSSVEGLHDLCDPGEVEIVEDFGIDARP